MACGVSMTSDREIDKVPKPGMVGEADFEVAHDNAHENQLSFESRAPEAQIRAEFEAYCASRGLHRSDQNSIRRERDWFESEKEGFGISISPSQRDKTLLAVTIYHRF